MKKIFNYFCFLILLFLFLSNISCKKWMSAKKKDEPITLSIIWWGQQSRHNKTLKVIEMFENENQDIKINPIYLNWTDYWDKLAALIAANEMPDIVQMVIQRLPQYIEKDLLTDIKEVKTINLKNLDETAIDAATINETLYGITLGVNAMCLAYDKAMFKKAKIDFPTPKWTWNDLENTAIKLYNKLDIYGIGQIAGDYNNFDVFLREHGERRFSKNAKHVGFTENTAVKFLKMALRLEISGAMEPINIYSPQRSIEEDSTYAQGKCAMRFMWSNLTNSIYIAKEKSSELMIYPGPNNDKGVYINPSMFFSVAKSSQYKEQAGKFIDFFINNIDANIILNAERGVPVSSKVRESLINNLDIQNKKIFEYIEFVSKYSNQPIDKIYPAYEANTRIILESVFEEVLHRELTPEQGAKKLIKEINKILSKK